MGEWEASCQFRVSQTCSLLQKPGVAGASQLQALQCCPARTFVGFPLLKGPAKFSLQVVLGPHARPETAPLAAEYTPLLISPPPLKIAFCPPPEGIRRLGSLPIGRPLRPTAFPFGSGF